MFLEGKGVKKSRESTGNSGVPKPIDVFVDTIIGFLEKSTTYLRIVGNQAFSRLSSCVEGTTIDLILAV